MTNTRAQAAKEKGNTAFKSGDYPSAIGHYSEAILADRTDPTLPLNRAAAYLKLGKNEDAERDSTTVLQLIPSNVKALFRRAQAREALGKLLDARQDLNDALAIEPKNMSIQDEAKKVDQLIATEKSKKAKVESARASVPTPSPITGASTSNPPPKRKRVPIEIIEPPGYQHPSQLPQSISATKATDVKTQQTTMPPVQPVLPAPVLTPPTTKPKLETDAMTPVSTRSLKSPSSSSVPLAQPSQSRPKPTTTASILTASATTASTATLPPKPSPSTFAEAKATRDSSKLSHVALSAGVGGGIFRPNGQNTTFSPRSQTSAPASAPTSSDRVRGETQLPTNGAQVTTPFPLNIAITGSPMTMFNFNKAWEANSSAEDRWKLITSIPPTNIPSLCKSSLEPSLFISIIDLLREVIESNSEQDKDTREVVKAYLKAFEGVPRFNTVLLFLSKKEKSRVRELWTLLGVENMSGIWNVLVK